MKHKGFELKHIEINKYYFDKHIKNKLRMEYQSYSKWMNEFDQTFIVFIKNYKNKWMFFKTI
jgi:hypothetical protein|tara:strand:- start:77 stop:262 length:186 start_codon:yes stop_codon:yes gene_type:complete